jgi:hypothetical protein
MRAKAAENYFQSIKASPKEKFDTQFMMIFSLT